MRKNKKPNIHFIEQKPRTIGGVLGGILGIIGLSVLVGSLTTSTIFPVVGFTSASATKTINTFEDLPSELELGTLMEKTNIYAKDSNDNNVLLASFFDQNREEVAWDQISLYAKDAAVAAEDPSFYTHSGIDLKGTGRAMATNILGDAELQGGSSITQQYVKNVLIQKSESISDPVLRKKAFKEATEKSLGRKIKEVRYSIELEKKYTKNQILTGYLNIAGFGGRIYGIQAAAKYYFNTTAADLTIPQAATLIAIVNNPNVLRLDQPNDEDNGAENGYERSRERRDYVLSSMLEHTKITKEEYRNAIETPVEPIITNPSTGCSTAVGGSGYFCDYVTWIVKNDPVFGESPDDRLATLSQGGLNIYTTLDLGLQSVSEAAINNYIPKSMNNGNIGSASISVQPATGRILAMAQNKDYSSDPSVLAQGTNWSSVNYNTDKESGGSSGFQPGSTYKIFTLLEWLNEGHSIYETVPGKRDYTHFTNSCDGDWYGTFNVRNDEGGSGGRITPLSATVGSVNTGFMSMAEKLDLCEIKNMAETFNVHRADGTPLQSNPTSVIGTNEVSGLSMATAMAGIANGGVVCTPIAIDRVTDSEGVELPAPKTTCSQGVEPGVAGAAAFALQQVMTRGTAASSNLKDGIPAIGKTGTTNDALHTWMLGSTTAVATAVWVGNVSGFTNMRGTYIGGIQASVIRHRIWPEIQRAANAKYGGGQFSAPNPALIGQ